MVLMGEEMLQSEMHSLARHKDVCLKSATNRT